jgi:hypothetical protein
MSSSSSGGAAFHKKLVTLSRIMATPCSRIDPGRLKARNFLRALVSASRC